jgi:hypothetical protein
MLKLGLIWVQSRAIFMPMSACGLVLADHLIRMAVWGGGNVVEFRQSSQLGVEGNVSLTLIQLHRAAISISGAVSNYQQASWPW